MISEKGYIELECSFVYSKAIFEVLKEDEYDIFDLWNPNQKLEEVSK